ncbi:hypothetical protein VNO78_32754 [Psophocarpus tetragonolobus]|uniref:Uncharacterized protein n=1 Tax=Psophocarpus tetragonolobus TaxID=3891 RepID=A0AAN9NVT2_PSOTE
MYLDLFSNPYNLSFTTEINGGAVIMIIIKKKSYISAVLVSTKFIDQMYGPILMDIYNIISICQSAFRNFPSLASSKGGENGGVKNKPVQVC